MPGTQAPPFRLQNQDEQWVELSELCAKGTVLLAFYPKDFGLVCTRQLCAYQEALRNFQSLGCQVVGISKNPPEAHRTFREQYGFEFELLSDPKHAIASHYNVTSLLMLGGTSRAVVIVNRAGVVVFRYVEPTTATHRKPAELLKILEKLRAEGALL